MQDGPKPTYVADHAPRAFPTSDDVLGSCGRPGVVSRNSHCLSPHRSTRDSFGTRSMLPTRSSWPRGRNARKGASAHSVGVSDRSSKANARMQTPPEERSAAGSSVSSASTSRSLSMHEQHAREIRETSLSQSQSWSRHGRHPSGPHVGGKGRQRSSPQSAVSVQFGPYPSLLAAAMADMSWSTSQGGSSEAATVSASPGGSSAALVAVAQSRSWHVNYTFYAVQGAAAKAAAAPCTA